MRILCLADIHIGAIKDCQYVYNTIVSIIDKELLLNKTDAVIILGDYFDRLFKGNEEYVGLAVNVMSALVRACQKNHTKIRLVYGTESHEYDQYHLFNYHFTSNKVDMKLITTCTEEELFPGCNVLYLPEEYISDKGEFYKDTLYSGKQYQYVFGHGVIEEGMPAIVSYGKTNKAEKQVPRFKAGELAQCGKLTCFGHHHCLPLDITEVLTEGGYKSFDALTYNDRIACWNKESGRVEFSKPENIIIRELDRDECLYRFHSAPMNGHPPERGVIDFVSTSGHRNVFNGEDVLSKNMPNMFQVKDMLPDIAGLDEKFVKNRFTDDELRLIAWIVGDGTFDIDQVHKTRIRFHMRKPRKISRLVSVLDSLHIEYSVHEQSSGTTKINIIGETQDYVKSLFDDPSKKAYPKDILYLSDHQFNVLMDELIMVDGDYESFVKSNGSYFRLNTSKKDEFSFLSELFIIHGRKHFLHTRRPLYYKDNYEDHNYMNLMPDVFGRRWIQKDLIRPSEKVAVGCVTVPTSYFIVKQNGIPYVTGNCHTDMDGNVHYIGSLFRYSFGEEKPKGYGVIVDDELQFVENDKAYIYKTYEFDQTSTIYNSNDDLVKEIDDIKKENEEIFNGGKTGMIRIIFHPDSNADPAFKENVKSMLFKDKFIKPMIKESTETLIDDTEDDVDDEYSFILSNSIPITDKIYRYINKKYEGVLTMDEIIQYINEPLKV